MSSQALSRLDLLKGQILPSFTSASKWVTKDLEPKYAGNMKIDWFKQVGWGFKDTEFVLDPKADEIGLTGSRYMFSGEMMPEFKDWAIKAAGVDLTLQSLPKKLMTPDHPILNEDFLEELGENYSRISFDDKERIMHSHGHTLKELYQLRNSRLERVADVVIYPASREQVETIVSLANKHNVVIIPYGGGTNVTQALMLSSEEKRMIISLDMARMNQILKVDKKNQTAHVQAGIIGAHLEEQLEKEGFVCGHEPDSVEFSTLGGWISTNASGMKKNRYGNIEQVVTNFTIVTPLGTYTWSKSSYQRVSQGPDLRHLIIGHEGNFGVITDAIIKIYPIPEAKVHGSIVFPDYQSTIDFMHNVAKSKIWPASIRLVDNTQFQFGMALKTPNHSKWKDAIDSFKKFVLKLKGFDLEQMCVCSLLFEGTKEEVDRQQKFIYNLMKSYGGLKAGEEAGIRSYFLTFVIAYIRDLFSNFNFVAESFETCVPWDKAESLIKSVQARIEDACRANGVKGQIFVSSRVTQVYETSCTIYVYFGFSSIGIPDPLQAYEAAEHAGRDEVIKCGGSVSHHHGVGKIRKEFVKDVIEPVGIQILQANKKAIDPKNIFACNNLIDHPDFPSSEQNH